MNTQTHRLDLPALDGANPLGFLAALGTAVVYSEADPSVRLGWRAGTRWTPFLETAVQLKPDDLADVLAKGLRGASLEEEAAAKLEKSKDRYNDAKKKLKEARNHLKQTGLRGSHREESRRVLVLPCERQFQRRRVVFLGRLKHAVASPELALGQRPDCSIAEFREMARGLIADVAVSGRKAVDLLAAFGAEISDDDDARVNSTPFCLVNGSGHQWFLDTARDLMARASADKVHEALFLPWMNCDLKYGMRWDPLDDRRHALMDRDPTEGDNKTRTVWMANLLGYRALALFPCAPCGARQDDGLAPTAAWCGSGAAPCFTWPVWTAPLGVASIRSLLGHLSFAEGGRPPSRAELRARGAAAVFGCQRIQVGKPPLHKLNFTPAVAI